MFIDRLTIALEGRRKRPQRIRVRHKRQGRSKDKIRSDSAKDEHITPHKSGAHSEAWKDAWRLYNSGNDDEWGTEV